MARSRMLKTTVHDTTHRRIVEGLRGEMMRGKLVPGTRLPSTRDLAKTWDSSPFTIHTALHELARQGWVDRRHGAGTYVADPRLRFRCAGIYYDSPMGAMDVSNFARNLAFALIAEIERSGKKFEIFNDPRPEHEQKTLLPDVAKAIYERRIQCLIAPRINFTNRDALLRIGVPAVFLGAVKLPLKASRTKPIPSVDTSYTQFFSEAMKHLVKRGCRSVGIICNIWLTGHPRDVYARFYDEFKREARSAGIVTRAEWIREPMTQVMDMEQHGYDDFKRLWKLRQKPDALVVYPDGVALGAIQAILETGAHRVADPMQFVFHQNARQKYFCSFPATFGVLDEDRLAGEMILQLQRQFDGEKPGMTTVPYRFVSG